jgi:glyoxylate reductase
MPRPTMSRALVTRRIPDAGLDLFRQQCEVVLNPEDRPFTREELLRKVRGMDGVLCLLTDRIDGEVMEAARGVKGFANFAVGFDNLDVPEATRRGCPSPTLRGCSRTPPPRWPGPSCSPWPAGSWNPTR